MTTISRRFVALAVVCAAWAAGCGKMEDTRPGDEASSRMAVATTTAKTQFPSGIVMKKGKVSTDQPLSVLSVRDQSGTADDWGKYRDFTPVSTGLTAEISFPAPSGVNTATSTLRLEANYKGWQKGKQVWKFSIYDYVGAKWVLLGDNTLAGSWVWSSLSYAVPGYLKRYISNGKLRVKYATTSGLENSNLDYLALAVLVPSDGSLPTPSPTPTSTPAPTPPPGGGFGRLPEGKLYGLTLDAVNDLTAIVDSLSRLSRFPTTRIVFDEFVPAADYRDAATRIYPVSYVLGEILDSFYMKDYTLATYQARVNEYMDTLGDKVDVWEVGNEINGEWLGNTNDTVAKMSAAYDIVAARGGVTELTLYYNEDCWEKPGNEMFTWAEANIPDRMKQGLHYVLVSYYEDDCNGLQPDWPPVFDRLGAMFPNSRIGFGEVGTTTATKKNEYINRYYSMTINHPRYIGGYFWWYGRQDFVPYTTGYWTTFNNVIAKQ